MSKKAGRQTSGKNDSSLPWLVVGGIAGFGAYFLGKALFKNSMASPQGSTQVMDLPAVANPDRFVNFDSVNDRYGQIRDLYHMGPSHMTAAQAIAEVLSLEDAANKFAAQGHVAKATADALVADMNDFIARVKDAEAFIQTQAAPPQIGRRQIRWN